MRRLHDQDVPESSYQSRKEGGLWQGFMAQAKATIVVTAFPVSALQKALGDHPRVVLTESLSYDRLVAAMRSCTLLLTDSGGLQEEAPAFGKPVLVLRHTTERPEAVDAGTVRLVGTDPDVIAFEAKRLLQDSNAYDVMAHATNPFGDGHASSKILVESISMLSPQTNNFA